MPNGAPIKYLVTSFRPRPSNPKLTESNSHEGPVSECEELRQWVEWNVASWSLGVVVWGSKIDTGGVETPSGDHRGRGGRADCSSRKHLCSDCQLAVISIGTADSLP